MRQPSQDEMMKIQQQMLAREVDEELRREQTRKFWKKHRWTVICAVVAVIAVTIGLELFGTWKVKTSLSESDRFESAVVLAFQGKSDEALTRLSELSARGRTGYKYLAALKSAGILINKGDKETGLNLLAQLMNDSAAPAELRDTARIVYVGHQVDTLPPEQIHTTLDSVLNPANQFYGSAVELSAVTYLRQKNPTAARNLLKQAIANESVPKNIRARLVELASVIE